MKRFAIIMFVGGIMCTELLEASKALLPFLSTSSEGTISDLLYRTPAMQMREAADRLEREDAAIMRFREAVKKCDEQ